MIHHARWAELTPALAHELLRLRVDVFVVEQQCPYPEIDGRDVEPTTVQFWHEPEDSPGIVAGCLRLLTDGPPRTQIIQRRIGRVCVAGWARGSGIAGQLMTAVLEHGGDTSVVLDAQSHLAGWYARYGFVPDGPEFLEDGILHTPMRRDHSPATARPTPHGRPAP